MDAASIASAKPLSEVQKALVSAGLSRSLSVLHFDAASLWIPVP